MQPNTRSGSSTQARTCALAFSILRLALCGALCLSCFLEALQRTAIC